MRLNHATGGEVSRALRFSLRGRPGLFHGDWICGILLAAVISGRSAEASAQAVPLKLRDLDPAAAARVSFAHQIHPILADNCLECHSAENPKGGLDAASVAGLIQGGKKGGPAVIPGKPDESPIIQYLQGLREPQMPKGNPPLSEDDLHLIRLWILAGAKDDAGSVMAEAKAGEAAHSAARTADVTEAGPVLTQALNDLLFSADNEERLFLQRDLRLKLLSPTPEPPQVRIPVSNPIDQFIVAKWEQAKLKAADQPPALCSDTIFLRRAYLDLIGVIPTAAEAQRFLEDNAADKRGRLVDELLARNEDYAAHWTPFWEEAIGSSNVGITGGIGSHGNHRNWIFQSFARNKPFDLMVAELIDPTLPGYRRPEVGDANGNRVVSAYIRNATHVETIQSAANVGQVFLGTGMKCASCHNHFLNKEWPQARFLAFAGLFANNDLELIRCEKSSGQFVAAQFPFDIPGAPTTAPSRIDGRQHRAAQLLIDPLNPRFAKTIVNRLWKRYLGLGLFESVDDFRLDQPPSHPELLAWLADDFMRHGYDLKHTIRLILSSRTYQLRYDPELEDHFDVNRPQQARYYRSPALRRLTAEQLLDSVAVAMSQELDAQHRRYLDKASTALTRALGRPAARTEISTGRSDDVAVVQALELLNGEEFYERIYSGKEIDQTTHQKELAQLVGRLYWVVFSRPASAQEQTLGAVFLQQSAALPDQAGEKPIGDVAWSLFASPEFQYIH